MTQAAKRLRKRLVGLDLILPEFIAIRRTYSGHNQRSQGSWSWYLVGQDHRAIDAGHGGMIGSIWPVWECLQSRNLGFYYREDIHIVVKDI